MKPIPREFYQRNTVQVAKELLGKILVRKLGNKTLTGIITETEAYRLSAINSSPTLVKSTPYCFLSIFNA